MADSTNDAGTEGQGGEGGESGNDGFKPITTPAELHAFLKDRVARVEQKAAEKYSDYDDLKAKASQLEQIEQEKKTEAEKTADRIAVLEQELSTSKSTALRARIQAKHGISDEDAELFLTATDEAALNRQAERLAERDSDRKKQGNRAPLQGRAPSNSDGDEEMREFTRGLFGNAAGE